MRLAKMLVEFDSEAKPHRLITKLIFMTEGGLELMTTDAPAYIMCVTMNSAVLCEGCMEII